jgi:hypothetical protein
MAMTVEDLERARAKLDALSELRAERAEAASRLAELESALAVAESSDFKERLGSRPLKEMTLRERSELVARIGYVRFRELVGGRHFR